MAARPGVALPKAKVAPEGGNGNHASVSERQSNDAMSLTDPSLYINRELSLLAFQRRVLEEAQDPSNPLLERVKFLSILGSNLDEFFMIRVAGLMRQAEAGTSDLSPDGMTPSEQLEAIRAEVANLMGVAHKCLRRELFPALEKAGIKIRECRQLSAAQRARAEKYFSETVFPVLTPLAFDPGRPFPHISNLSLNLAVLIRDAEGQQRFARVKVPATLPQLISVDSPHRPATRKKASARQQQTFVWLEDIIASNLAALFPGMEVLEAHPFHVTRDAEMAIQELEAVDLLETTEEGLRQRRFGDVVRLQVSSAMPSEVLKILVSNLDVSRKQLSRHTGPFSLSRLKYLAALDREDLKDPAFLPVVPPVLHSGNEDEDIFSVIRSRDVFLHHPFDSFQPVVDFLKKSAKDPSVLAIKMTLYRVGRNSPVVEALLEASEEEKQVAALLELKARFDEESNLEWARALERQGVHVVYGLLGLKVHSKIALVVRQEGERIQRYVHLGTGNYNPVTAHLYTDLGLLTADEDIGADATDLFNYLTGYSSKKNYRKLLVAPINMREKIEEMIRREIQRNRDSGDGHLIFKMNALEDPDMIRLLYEASQAGVKVDLLVRGICCLRPGVPGVSENIRVISIVGRFLEHSRIYYFHNGGEEQIYLGSADLMSRNLIRRVEVLFPVEDRRLVRLLRDRVLETYLADNVKAREMQADGNYSRRNGNSNKHPFNSQEWLLKGQPHRPRRTK